MVANTNCQRHGYPLTQELRLCISRRPQKVAPREMPPVVRLFLMLVGGEDDLSEIKLVTAQY